MYLHVQLLRGSGKAFHPQCFVCVECGRNMDNVVFTVDSKNQIHCMDDFYRYGLTSLTPILCCRGITRNIQEGRGQNMSSENKYIPIYNKTLVFGLILPVNTFLACFSNDVDVVCLHRKYAPRCSVCQEAIKLDPDKKEIIRIVVRDRNFHVQCYKCEVRIIAIHGICMKYEVKMVQNSNFTKSVRPPPLST